MTRRRKQKLKGVSESGKVFLFLDGKNWYDEKTRFHLTLNSDLSHIK